MKKVIRNGTVIDPSQNIEGEFDLIIEDKKILDIVKPGTAVSDAEVIDAKGCWVTPGLVDIHVHLREPGFEWKETIKSGATSAVMGGFTTVCCMPNTNPVNDTPEITDFIIRKAKEAKLAKVHPIAAVSKGLKGEKMAPLGELKDAGACAFSDDGEPVWDSAMMRRALEWCKMLDSVVTAHEEDKRISMGGAMNEGEVSTRLGLAGWPALAEELLIARDIEIARYVGGRVHFCHVTTKRGVELIRRAKNDGIDVSGEVSAHHLLLTEERVGNYDTDAKMSPPLRTAEDCAAMFEGLKDGTIEVIASDHAPHEIDKKKIEFGLAAFGIVGLQTTVPMLLPLVKEGKISRSAFVKSLTSAPSKIFRLDSGTLKKGSFADVTVYDPAQKWVFSKETNKSLSHNSPWLNSEMIGNARHVLVDGRIVVSNGNLV